MKLSMLAASLALFAHSHVPPAQWKLVGMLPTPGNVTDTSTTVEQS